VEHDHVLCELLGFEMTLEQDTYYQRIVFGDAQDRQPKARSGLMRKRSS